MVRMSTHYPLSYFLPQNRASSRSKSILISHTDIDEKGGSVYDNFEAAESRRKETLEYLRCFLDSKKPASYTKPTSPLVLSFKPIGDSLRKDFTTGEHCGVNVSNGGLC